MNSVFVAGALVEPALDHHEGAGHGKAGEGTQQDPEQFVDEEAGHQRDDGAGRRECTECAHVAGTANDTRREIAAGDEAPRPGGSHQAERSG
jgi:hypothetical protein